MKKEKKRAYISLYFEDGLIGKRKKRDFTVAFDPKELLYTKCKKLGSTKIKELIGTNSYQELVTYARKENRSLGNYVKHKLRHKLTGAL
ncbi:MAG: hypothetical protein LUQ20_05165 [Candidatus Methanoperedens sp.]|nr:hypothetical protein [Candidatus Methanoperedens sp.]